MTYDELKSKIDEMHYFGGLGNVSQFYNVIRQVVQLHKPVMSNTLEICNECNQLRKVDDPVIVYPCPTIQAIQKGVR